ncbi:MAG: SDR family oxidoreductase [Clostridia bacterium]|nr:SDR family oxidoreductase [Clostridia bacterium]
MKILVLGSTGMAGHMIAAVLSERGHAVTGFSRSGKGVVPTVAGDATDDRLLETVLSEGNYDAVVNCIGILNADAEARKDAAVYLNAYLPHRLAKLCEGTRTRIVHLSTDCVFSGARGAYAVTDTPDGTTFYDRTKALGELNDDRNLTIRTSIVGPDPDPKGIGLVNWFLQQTESVNGYTGSVWNGITTLELAHTVEHCLKHCVSGIIQPTVPAGVTKYDLLRMTAEIFGRSDITLVPVPGVVHNKTLLRTPVPGMETAPDYETMLRDLRDWVLRHRELYPHYRMEGNTPWQN